VLKAVLLDLDNTLLFVDEMEFFLHYLPRVAGAFSDIIPLDEFQGKLVRSAQAFMRNDGKISNKEYFLNEFSSGLPTPKEEIWERFMKFYTSEFDQFRSLVRVPEGVREVLLELREKNLKLVIATNPVWPLTVQLQRLSWAGIDDLPYELVTSIENMSFCKPRLEYYREVCGKIREEPERCLMVGNDLVNDMVGGKIGMKTFLTEGGGEEADGSLSLSRRSSDAQAVELVEPDFRGLLSEVPGVVDTLLGDK